MKKSLVEIANWMSHLWFKLFILLWFPKDYDTNVYFFILDTTEADLKKTVEEKERLTKEKDEEIDGLNLKISGMEKDYERILDVSESMKLSMVLTCVSIMFSRYLIKRPPLELKSGLNSKLVLIARHVDVFVMKGCKSSLTLNNLWPFISGASN